MKTIDEKIDKGKIHLKKGDLSFTPQSPRMVLGLVYGEEFLKHIK